MEEGGGGGVAVAVGDVVVVLLLMLSPFSAISRRLPHPITARGRLSAPGAACNTMQTPMFTTGGMERQRERGREREKEGGGGGE